MKPEIVIAPIFTGGRLIEAKRKRHNQRYGYDSLAPRGVASEPVERQADTQRQRDVGVEKCVRVDTSAARESDAESDRGDRIKRAEDDVFVVSPKESKHAHCYDRYGRPEKPWADIGDQQREGVVACRSEV